MSRDEIEALIDRRERAWNARDAHALALDHAEDGVVESPLAGGNATGREAIEKLYATYFRAFTDFKLETTRPADRRGPGGAFRLCRRHRPAAGSWAWSRPAAP